MPDIVWDFEKVKSHRVQNIRTTDQPPSKACINLKVIYNEFWVQSVGNGVVATANQLALDVISEAQNIYNTEYDPANRLGTAVRFNIIGGKSA